MGLLSRRRAIKYSEEASVRYEEGDLEGAERFVLLGLKEDEKLAYLHYLYGQILIDTARPRAAEKELKRAIELDPGSAESYSLLGSLLHQQGRLKEAEENYLNALKLKPDYVNVYRNLITLYRDSMQFERVSETAKEALGHITDPAVKREFEEFIF